MKENIVSIGTQIGTALGKMIPTRASALRKLSDSLAACTAALTAAEREQRDAAAILAEAAPAGFDFAGAGRTIAEARVADLLQGSSTAEGVQQRLDHEKAAAESAAAAYAKRQADARGQAERAGPMVAALRAQALELDRAVRHELVRLGREMEDGATQALNAAIECYITAYVSFRAAIWLQHVGEPGERGRQFSFPREDDIKLVVPDACRSDVPEGWQQSADSGTVTWDRYGIARRVNERVTEVMFENTAGLYPKAGADLVQQQDS